jgi:triosephosphate isomerase
MAKGKFLVIGNWKSNKTVKESLEWFDWFGKLWQKQNIPQEHIRVILCVSFIHVFPLYHRIKTTGVPLELGVQDISPFKSGAYTGAVSAEMIKDLVTFTLIGHSERRKHFDENEEVLAEKVARAREAKLDIGYCVQHGEMSIPGGVHIVGYEPVWAIGTGKADTPENANAVATQIKAHSQGVSVVYGGSVTAENVAGYVQQSAIDGVLPGGVSLDPTKFIQLITNAANSSAII